MSRILSPPASPYHRPAARSAAVFPRIPSNPQVPFVLRVVGILLLGLAIGVAATVGYLYFQGTGPTAEDRVQPAARPAKSSVVAQGILEPRSGPVLVGSALI